MEIPGYMQLGQDGLKKRRVKADQILKHCTLCPRNCKVDRVQNEMGICNTGRSAIVSSYSPHVGEEAPLVGRNGSGTIFFTHCSLQCVFCQNYEISKLGEGEEVSSSTLARMMVSLHGMGCHNINFVTPSHVVPQILAALEIAIEHGLNIPLVYNSSGYDQVDTLQLLDGIFDIYMPDIKFTDPEVSKMACNAPEYPETVKAAVREMHRQVGDLIVDDMGVARKGLIVRHLVMPDGLAGTRGIMKFLASDISTNTYINIMPQYRPCGDAYKYSQFSRQITCEEYEKAIQTAHEEGLYRLDE